MPWPDRITASLRRLYHARERALGYDLSDLSVPPASLEQDLLRRHAARHPPRPAGAWAFVRAHRLALSSGLAGIALAAACQLPVDYDRAFGATVWCEADAASAFDGLARGLADRLRERTAAEQVAVRVHAEQPGGATLRIDLFGEGPTVAAEDLLAEAALPSDARCSVEPLVETVHGTLGGRLGLELFDLDLLDRDDAEAARAQILERLQARGLHGNTEVEVEVSELGDGRREVKIRIEAEGDLPQ
ncbi:MAG TPA: hypothetical protein VIK91_23940 [Nannocystis sp.]